MGQVLSDSLRVELGLSSTPLTALSAVTWTDATSSVLLTEGVTFNRGRSGFDTTARPGTLSLTLDNSKQKGTEGRFTPGGSNCLAGFGLRIPIRVRSRYPYVGNLVSNNSFEVDTTGWFGSGGASIARSTTRAVSGTGSLLVTWATTAGGVQNALYTLSTVIGRTYTVSMSVYVPTGSPSVAVECLYVAYSAAVTTKDAWVRTSVTFTATGGTHYIGLQQVGAATAGQTAYVDAVQVEDGSTMSTFSSTYSDYTDLWYGYIESVDLDWDNGVRPTVKVSATDRLGRLQRRALSQSLATMEQLSDGPTACWPLDDDGSTYTLTDRTGVAGVPSLTLTLNGAAGSNLFSLGSSTANLGPDGITSCLVLNRASSTNGYYAFAPYVRGVYRTNIGFTFDCLFYVGTAGTQMGLVYLSDTRIGSGTQVGMYVTSGNKLAAEDIWQGASITGATTVTAGAWHHAALQERISGGTVTMELWLDGVSQGTASWSGSTTFTDNGILVGARDASTGPFDLASGRIANVSYENEATATTSARIAERAKARNGFSGETSGTRFSRLCRIAGLPSTEYTTVGTTVATMQAQPVKGLYLFDVAGECAEAEVGVCYLNRSGQLALSARSTRYNPSSSFTLPATSIDKGTGFTLDMSAILNDVTFNRPGGITSRSINAASVAAYDTHDYSSSIYVDTDQQVIDTASWYSNFQAVPKPRVTDIKVDLVTQASPLSASLPTILTTDIGALFTVSGLPSASTPASTFTLFVEGVTDRVTPTSWERSFVASPNANTSAGILDSATYGLLDSTAILAF